MSFQHRVTIRESQIDSMGHVNNAAYLTFFEEARWEMMAQQGFGVEDVRARQQGPVILELNVKFLKELRLRDTVAITCEILDYKGKVGRLIQKMIKEDGSVAAEAVFTFGVFDLKTRRLIDPPPEWKKVFGL